MKWKKDSSCRACLLFCWVLMRKKNCKQIRLWCSVVTILVFTLRKTLYKNCALLFYLMVFTQVSVKSKVIKIHKTKLQANRSDFWCKLHISQWQIQPPPCHFSGMFDSIVSGSTGNLRRICFSFSVVIMTIYKGYSLSQLKMFCT